jgi:hypothetical protein
MKNLTLFFARARPDISSEIQETQKLRLWSSGLLCFVIFCFVPTFWIDTEDAGNMFLQYVHIEPEDYTVQQHRSLQSKLTPLLNLKSNTENCPILSVMEWSCSQQGLDILKELVQHFPENLLIFL